MTEQETRTRYATIAVKVPVAWLTADGEGTEEEGWKELEKDLQGHLDRFGSYPSYMVPSQGQPKASFEEWEQEQVPA